MRGYVAAAGAALLLLAGCSSEPSEAEQRAADCEAFAAETPGTLERSWAHAMWRDPDSTEDERVAAAKALARETNGDKRDHPYNCDWPAYQALFSYYRDLRAE
ncbi:hypothetical protein K3M35_05085 [Rhodococcus sp. DMU2021]|uniref:hypothetical protein n=1 Tax=Rhodococcus sp. DMU2021 TaxID=2866997 RepID=UPI001C7CD860|nr:hypothetical protein [Rhodococcus sp. DMU2021]MBX4168040.1 hypothetical protein [Rhodococcus sp. DMU2021]